MISPSNNPQPVVFIIHNSHGNNYVNHGVQSQTPETTCKECAQAGHMLAPRSPLCEAQKMGKSSTTSNNLMGFPEGEDTNSLNKEIGTISNGSHSPNKEWDPEYTTPKSSIHCCAKEDCPKHRRTWYGGKCLTMQDQH